VRGTTRRPESVEAIEAIGAEADIADPDRLATLLPHVEGVSAVCWLMGSAAGRPQIHGPRLASFLETLVDTPVRGFVYEASGAARDGARIVRAAGQTHRLPVEVVGTDPADHAGWLRAMTAAVGRILA
jgi:hypothetical protein